jgi:hypothetical protein
LALALNYSGIKIAPTIIKANPNAARGVNQGRMPVNTGRTSRMAPRISSVPIKRTWFCKKFSIHCMFFAGFSLGWINFIDPASKKTMASSTCTINIAAFIENFSWIIVQN